MNLIISHTVPNSEGLLDRRFGKRAAVFVAVLGMALWLAAPRQGLAATSCETPTVSDIFNLSCFLEVIHWVEVAFGSGDEKQEEANGLNKNELEKLVRLRLRNDLSILKYEAWNPFGKKSKIIELGNNLIKYGRVECFVWNVGDDYPIV